jgi:hypothetical protein
MIGDQFRCVWGNGDSGSKNRIILETASRNHSLDHFFQYVVVEVK